MSRRYYVDKPLTGISLEEYVKKAIADGNEQTLIPLLQSLGPELKSKYRKVWANAQAKKREGIRNVKEKKGCS